MTISITLSDITSGICKASDSCPVALAVRRAFPEEDYIYIGGTISFIGQKKILLPDKIVRFIHAFDSGEKVAPVEFELESCLSIV